jgi:tetratricopeptide (TPR) repeat protein
MLCHWGYPLKSREQYEISQNLAPSKVTVYRGLARSYYMERRYTNAIDYCQKALEQEPHHVDAYGLLGPIYQAISDYTNAIESFRKEQLLRGDNASEAFQDFDAQRRALKAGGALGYWHECWKETYERNPNGDFYKKAVIQMHLGNTNTALAWLNKCYEAEARGGWHSSPLSELLVEHYWDGLHDDSQFKTLLERIGFTTVMPPPKH